MAIIIEMPNGSRIKVDADSVLIGRDRSCQIALPDESVLQPIHAKIRKVANRWMVEAQGEWQIQVGAGLPGRTSWLQSGDTIRLGGGGRPELVFWEGQPSYHPPTRPAPLPQREVSPVRAKGWLDAVPNAAASPPAPVDSPPPSDEWFCEKSGTRLGPFSLAELQRLVESGALTLQDTVWRSGMPNGVPAESVKALRAASLGLSSFYRVTEKK
jgi:hypothetical protein